MRALWLTGPLLVYLALTGCQAAGPRGLTKVDAGVYRGELETVAQKPVELEYLLYEPAGARADDGPWPLILFLHGAGERGDDLNQVRTQGLPAKIERDGPLPALVAAPQCPAGGWWRPVELKALLDHLLTTQPVDRDRVYLTGLSMGGTGTWLLAAECPEMFAALAPVCGRTLRLRAAPIADLPIWVVHGDADPVVHVRNSELMVEYLASAGAERLKFTKVPGGTHDVWTDFYADPQFYEWLFAQRRASKE